MHIYMMAPAMYIYLVALCPHGEEEEEEDEDGHTH